MLSCFRRATSALFRNFTIDDITKPRQCTIISPTLLKPVFNFFRNPSHSSSSSSCYNNYVRNQSPQNWLLGNKWVVGGCILITSGVFAFYFSNIETIPYTKRKHFVLLSSSTERWIGDDWLEFIKKKELKDKILPATHPDSARVESIFKNILNASRNHEQMKELKLHLELLNWEVLVVDEPNVLAYSLAGGKVVVSTLLLELLPSDAEIATVIGHEIGHVVARHSADRISKILLLLPFVASGFPIEKLWRSSSLQRSEFEADYIGMLLMASAGYDPRLAPGVFRKLAFMGDEDEESDTHPPCKERARCLARANVMGEALALYMKFQKFRESYQTPGLGAIISPDPVRTPKLS